MTREEKYKLIELLEKLRKERIEETAKDYDMKVNEVEELLDKNPEEIYEMDDGDNLLQGIDTVLCALE